DLRYELSIEREGFTKYRITNVDPAPGEDLTVKVSMQPGSPPYAPIEQNLAPVVPIESPSTSSTVWKQPTNSCSPSGVKTERAKIDSKNGQISGSITDQMGALVPGITVRLFQAKTMVAIINSDANGSFAMKNIQPGKNLQTQDGR
ncbi:MAG: carboxypeptidase-like regulatory domain-containing protein, partial [bacterium]|nr:carboxypeptidase-like regulatory domain-containing protein [bacterium]